MEYIDLHCDTISRLEESKAGTLKKNSFYIDLEKLEAGGCLLQTFALFVDRGSCEDPWQQYRRLLTRFHTELTDSTPRRSLITNRAQFLEKCRTHTRMALLSAEEGEICGGNLDRLHMMFHDGVRMMTLTWNYKNSLGAPNRLPGYDGHTLMEPETQIGLTPRGIAVVEEMERLSMMIDVSHLGDRGIRQVLKYAKGPILASHSNARSVCGHVRNLPDDLIAAIAGRGGVIGINFYPKFLSDDGLDGSFSQLILHMRHLMRVGGEECVCLGTDFDGCDGALAVPDASHMPLLAEAMSRAGFSERQTENIFSGNARRFLVQMLPDSETKWT